MKGNVIRLNIMHLNSVQMNSIGEVQSVSLKAGESTEDPVYPPTTYTLAANVSNGKVTATKNGTAISLPYVATEGDVIVLSVTPDEGYEFNGWLDGNKSNPRTVTMTGNVVLSASCVEIAKPTYTLSASVTNGKVSAKRNGSAVSLPYTANEGDVIIVEVTPNDGYTFEGWADGNTDNPRTITMTADVVLSAQCVEVVQPPVGNYIQFEDKAVEAICVANWSSDGIGLTEEDAAAVTSIGTTFKGNTEITSFDEFRYFTGVTSLTTSAFDGCSALSSIKFPNAITLGEYAFRNCVSLSSVDWDNIADIKYGAFYLCASLPSEVSIPNMNGGIGQAAFYKCTSIIKFLASATSIDTSAFDNCKLEEATLLNATYLGVSAFNRNGQLKVVRLRDVTTFIGDVFYACAKLEKVIVENATPPSLSGTAFQAASSDFLIYVPDASLEAYKGATNWKNFSSRIKPLSELSDE